MPPPYSAMKTLILVLVGKVATKLPVYNIDWDFMVYDGVTDMETIT